MDKVVKSFVRSMGMLHWFNFLFFFFIVFRMDTLQGLFIEKNCAEKA